MARKVIGGTSATDKHSEDSSALLESLKRYSNNSTKVTLFKTKLPKLSQADLDYKYCAKCLKLLTEDNSYTCEVSMRQICSFFTLQYKHFYNLECIDYNYFNSSKVFDKVKHTLNLETNLHLLEFLALSFLRFDSVSKSLNLNDERLYISTFRQNWIIQELNNSTKNRIAGFY